MKLDLRMSLLAVVLASLALTALDAQSSGNPAAMAEPERVAAGHSSYRVYCANCHGESGRGDGPMREILKVPPADLTRLAASHQGRFPREEAYQAIDGRRNVRGHGTAAMPVWGVTFQDLGRDTPQEREVQETIRDLLAYLESIQTPR